MLELLLSIPKDVVRSQIVSFLDLKSLVTLDTATMAHEHRQNMLTHVLFGAEVTDYWVYDINRAKWLLLRTVLPQCIVLRDNTSDADLNAVLSILSKVTRLTLIKSTKLSFDVVLSLFEKCGILKCLDISSCPWLVDDTMLLLSRRLYSLVQLELTHLPHVTDEGVANVISKCNQLRVVRLYRCAQLGDLVVTALGNCSLIDLDLSHCAETSETSMHKFLIHNGKILQTLRLIENNGITDNTMLAVASLCPQLRTLDIDHCINVGETGLCAILPTCQSLTSLSVDSVMLSPHTIHTMCACVSTKLEYLCLTGSELVDANIEGIVSRAFELEELHIPYMEQLTSNSLIYIGKHLSNLIVLNVRACTEFAPVGFIALAQGCPKLIELDVSYCEHFTDDCLHTIATHCINLNALYISNIPALTDIGVKYVAMHCPNLTFVDLIGTSVTEPMLGQIIERCLYLELLGWRIEDVKSQSLLQLVRQRKITVS